MKVDITSRRVSATFVFPSFPQRCLRLILSEHRPVFCDSALCLKPQKQLLNYSYLFILLQNIRSQVVSLTLTLSFENLCFWYHYLQIIRYYVRQCSWNVFGLSSTWVRPSKQTISEKTGADLEEKSVTC